MLIQFLLAAVVGYGLGSIPFGLLLTRMAGMGDIRDIGSGNIGATNVLRTGNKPIAAATLLFDAGKGAAAVLIVRALWGNDAALIAGLFGFAGHCFPVWLSFKGGKGVAVFIGILLGAAWPIGLIFCAVWLFIAIVRRTSSLAALTAAGTAPIFSFVWNDAKLAAVAGVLALLLFYRHAPNIRRLLDGTEPKIGAGK